jgi:hypothetical protein
MKILHKLPLFIDKKVEFFTATAAADLQKESLRPPSRWAFTEDFFRQLFEHRSVSFIPRRMPGTFSPWRYIFQSFLLDHSPDLRFTLTGDAETVSTYFPYQESRDVFGLGVSNLQKRAGKSI